MIWRWLYSAVGYAATPLLLLRLWQRGRQQPHYRQDWRERFGYYHQHLSAPVIWLHAVSVGETRAAAPLIQALLQRYPQHRILLTQMTPTGRATAQQLFGEQVTLAYLPYDQPAAVKRFFRHFKPALGVLLETELWPNLICIAAAHKIPLCLVNARLSAKSFKGYRRIRGLIAPALRDLRLIAAQSSADAERLTALASPQAPPIAVMGNLKFDFTPPADQIALGQSWRKAVAPHRPVLTAGCTRDGEELLLIEALAELPAQVLLVLVPRHPQRCAEVAAILASQQIRFELRSAGMDQAVDDGVRVVLGDSLGELAAYYAMADVAFVGGSLVDLGSHNLIEPCAQGIPVLLGPSMFNFAEASRDALACGAAMQITSASAMLQTAAKLIGDPAQRESMSTAGRAFVAQHRGATARALELIAPLLA